MWTIRETILGVFPCNVDWKGNNQNAYTGLLSVSIVLLFCGTLLSLHIQGWSQTLVVFLQTVFIICVCNNQLLDWVENELIYILSFVPGFATALPALAAKLRLMKEKYLVASPPVTSDINVTHSCLWSWLRWLPFLHCCSAFWVVYWMIVVFGSQVKKWDLSFASVWNGVVWLMLLNFFCQIVTATAQRYLKKQQEKELDALTKKKSSPVSKKSN